MKQKHIVYTDEQKQQAREIDIISFLETHEGYSFQKKGSGYKCIEHDSLFIRSDRRGWYWNSRQVGGANAIDYCLKVKDMSYSDTLLTILGDNTVAYSKSLPPANKLAEKVVNKQLILPEQAENNKRLFAYLTKTRGIDENIVNDLIRKNKIYQDKNGNVVFVERDATGKEIFASKRGTLTGKKYVRDCVGSNKRYTFSTQGIKPDTLFVFEGAIDLLSHATLANRIIKNPKAWTVHKRLSLSGLDDGALERYLSDDKDIKKIYICFDNDIDGVLEVTNPDGTVSTVPHNHGQVAAQELKRKYTALGYEVENCVPVQKDMNAELLNYRKDNLSEEKNMIRR